MSVRASINLLSNTGAYHSCARPRAAEEPLQILRANISDRHAIYQSTIHLLAHNILSDIVSALPSVVNLQEPEPPIRSVCSSLLDILYSARLGNIALRRSTSTSHSHSRAALIVRCMPFFTMNTCQPCHLKLGLYL